jgi:tyrosyl-tRNA synthetase
VSINKEKVSDIAANIDESHILDEKYILVQKGKKNYFLIHVK